MDRTRSKLMTTVCEDQEDMLPWIRFDRSLYMLVFNFSAEHSDATLELPNLGRI